MARAAEQPHAWPRLGTRPRRLGFLDAAAAERRYVARRAKVRRDLESKGFVTVRGAFGDSERQRLLHLLEPDRLHGAARRRSGILFGARHLLVTIPELRTELEAAGVDALASRALEQAAFPIDAAYFDKQSGANWTVPVHQDRVLPVAPDVKRKHRMINGVAVSEPRSSTLARLLALRIHFDPTGGETGALFVLPASHTSGVLTPDQIRDIPLTSFVPCVANVGDALLLRPLLLHRSPPSMSPSRRRVLHVVYATEEPDDDLRWRASFS
jgi:hypothetical protein